MDKNGGAVRSEGGAEAVNISEVEVSGPGDVIDVRMERECAVEDDTQTLNLMGGEDQGAVKGEGEGAYF